VAGHTVSTTVSYSDIRTNTAFKGDTTRAFDLGTDYTHSNSRVGFPVTAVNFRSTSTAGAKKLYVGAKIAIYVNSGVAPAVYEITSISNLVSGKEVSVSYVSGGALTYANLDAATAVGSGTGNSRWGLIDSNLDYCSETGFATLSAAKVAVFPSDISTLLRYRAIHARWMRDLPKSLWFQKTFGVIEKQPVVSGTTNNIIDPGVFRTGQSIIMATGNGFDSSVSGVSDMATNGGVAEVVDANGKVDSFTFDGLGNLTGGKYQTISNARFNTQYFSAGTKTIHLRNIRSDYRHIWVLWADMRNDGTANASDGTRKSSFGLLLPTPDQYKLSIEYTDQEKVDGEAIPLTDLSIGEDVNIWELDATNEPLTGAAWSALPGGSNSEAESSYHNWEEKAGAFVVIDSSKFWNLNTEANGGKTGQLGGGRTDLQDYLAVNSGIPSMMDNFYIEGMPSYKNVAAPFQEHPDQLNFIHDASPIVADFSGTSTVNGAILQVDDVSQWRDNGVGRIVGVSGSGANRTVYQWY